LLIGILCSIRDNRGASRCRVKTKPRRGAPRKFISRLDGRWFLCDHGGSRTMALYDRIGAGFDATRSADPYLTSRLIHHLRPAARARYLDVGSGTANYTGALADAGLRMTGLEISLEMISRARAKRPALELVRASADALPFRAGAFAGAVCTFVHHHLPDPVAAFAEVRRVLAPGAHLVVLNGTAEQLRHYWLCEYFPRTMERAAEPLDRFVAAQALASAGFEIETTELYEVREDLRDWFLYCGKHHPERYLDARVRSGISCFANGPDPIEIERGVNRLAADIESGRIAEVMRAYAWDGGDYMFNVARR
jgi:ubiquinone/menaquinone biosynthesis C-methylase UbiE